MRHFALALTTAALALSVGCDYTGDFLFAGHIDGVRGVDHLGELTPAVITSAEELQGAVKYGEIGPTGNSARGGVTFTFRGTGGHVCVFVDPETVFWNQSVATIGPVQRYIYPDNVFDDGDLDLTAGFATYYTGTPATEEEGGEIGDFKVRYQDSLGGEVQVAFNECVIVSSNQGAGGHSGRGAPEYCTLANTQPGVSYVVLMETWSTPLDDDRLGYGVILADGSCEAMIDATARSLECVITGESIDPATGTAGAGSVDFEEYFCADDDAHSLPDYCMEEAALVAAGQKDCAVDHCFCGDPADTPTPGAF